MFWKTKGIVNKYIHACSVYARRISLLNLQSSSLNYLDNIQANSLAKPLLYACSVFFSVTCWENFSFSL